MAWFRRRNKPEAGETLRAAMERHNGDVAEVILQEPFEHWPIKDAILLFAGLARYLAKESKK